MIIKAVAVLALALAAFATGVQLRADGATPMQSVAVSKYQIVPQTGGVVIRLNTHTGDMTAFLVGPKQLVAESLGATKEYGAMQFIEMARSPREGATQ
jgi:hypothetical protein